MPISAGRAVHRMGGIMGAHYDTVKEIQGEGLWVNDQLVARSADDHWHAVQYWLSDLAPEWTNAPCPYCPTKMVSTRRVRHGKAEGLSEVFDEAIVHQCPSCGHWSCCSYGLLGQGPYGCSEAEVIWWVSKIREFSPDLPEGCESEIAQQLRRNPDLWHRLEPRALVRGESKEMLLSPRYGPVEGHWQEHPLAPEIDEIAAGSFKRRQPPEIAGTGHVVRSLETALWAF